MRLEVHQSGALQCRISATSVWELAMLVLATALVAQESARAAGGCVPVLRISFVKGLELLHPNWLVISLPRKVPNQKAERQLACIFDTEIRRRFKPKRARAPAPVPSANPSTPMATGAMTNP